MNLVRPFRWTATWCHVAETGEEGGKILAASVDLAVGVDRRSEEEVITAEGKYSFNCALGISRSNPPNKITGQAERYV